MGNELLNQNIKQMNEIIREIYIFTNQLNLINNSRKRDIIIGLKEKKVFEEVIEALTIQLRILNNSIPELVRTIGFYKKFPGIGKELFEKNERGKKLIRVKYEYSKENPISLAINEKDKKEFLENLSKSHLSIENLKKKYAIQPNQEFQFGKPNSYAKISNRFFRGLSNKLIADGYFANLNRSLRKMNSPFVVGTYVSMIFFTICLSFIVSILLSIVLLFFNINILFPFFTLYEGSILLRFFRVFWIIFAVPITTGLLMYFYPASEGKSIGLRMDQEMPFVAIHMSAIASSGLEPLNIFKIILKREEYRYTIVEIRKLMNLINFHGKDLVTALRSVSASCPSYKLKELLDGMATTITSGGDLYKFLDEHVESLLFDYRLERERYTKTSETFMDIYISIVIAAPMILLMLFVIMGSTGMLSNFLGLSIGVLSLLIILIIVALNLGFLIFLKIKQPNI